MSSALSSASKTISRALVLSITMAGVEISPPAEQLQINCRFTETVDRAVDRFPLQSLTYLRAQNIREAAHECCRTNRDGMFFQMTAKGIAPFLLTIVRLLYAESKNFSFGCFLKRSYCEEYTGSVRTACKSAYRVFKQRQHMLARCIENPRLRLRRNPGRQNRWRPGRRRKKSELSSLLSVILLFEYRECVLHPRGSFALRFWWQAWPNEPPGYVV